MSAAQLNCLSVILVIYLWHSYRLQHIVNTMPRYKTKIRYQIEKVRTALIKMQQIIDTDWKKNPEIAKTSRDGESYFVLETYKALCM